MNKPDVTVFLNTNSAMLSKDATPYDFALGGVSSCPAFYIKLLAGKRRFMLKIN